MKQLFTAASVEEAKELAAREFGVSEEKISFNVIEEPKKGLFGKIKGEAKVEAEYTRTKVDIAVYAGNGDHKRYRQRTGK